MGNGGVATAEPRRKAGADLQVGLEDELQVVELLMELPLGREQAVHIGLFEPGGVSALLLKRVAPPGPKTVTGWIRNLLVAVSIRPACSVQSPHVAEHDWLMISMIAWCSANSARFLPSRNTRHTHHRLACGVCARSVCKECAVLVCMVC